MSELTLFHGSPQIVHRPLYGYGKSYNDYGQGFYCTEHADMAKEWAVGGNRDGHINKYALDKEGLELLNLNAERYTILHWLAVLLENRTLAVRGPLALEAIDYLRERFRVPYREADVVIGYRADDSYFSFAQDFVNGAISLRQLGEAMHLGRLGRQVVLISAKAFERVRFVHSEAVLASEWYCKRAERDAQARADYANLERSRHKKGDLYITHILDEEMGPDDPRLR